jgi:Cu-Zn family superoxide dismutase
MRRALVGTSLAVILIAALAGAPGASGQEADATMATLVNQSGAEVGTVVIAPSGSMLIVNVEARNLPAGFHGFHVHAVGQCQGDFTSAGGHENPDGTVHSLHRGDMPSLLVNSDGTAAATFLIDRLTVAELLDTDGSAIIVHADPDNFANIPSRYVAEPDMTTLTTGDAGARIACGVLQPARLP